MISRIVPNSWTSVAETESEFREISYPDLTVSAAASRDVLLAGGSMRRSQGASYWLPSVIHRLAHIAGLPENWDSYRGRRLQPGVAQDVLRFLTAYQGVIQSEPLISLTPDGGISCEWVTDSMLFELSVTPDATFLIYFRDDVSSREVEGVLDDFPNVEKALWFASAEAGPR